MLKQKRQISVKRITLFVIIMALALVSAFFSGSESLGDATDSPEPSSEQSGAIEPMPEPVKLGSVDQPPDPGPDWSSREYAKKRLKSILMDDNQGTELDYAILVEVIECESGWRQYINLGDAGLGPVIVNMGNVGFGQINRGTWQEFFTKNFDLDIYDPEDNLQATVILYKWQGLSPWLQWSGPCFMPRLEAQGITLH